MNVTFNKLTEGTIIIGDKVFTVPNKTYTVTTEEGGLKLLKSLEERKSIAIISIINDNEQEIFPVMDEQLESNFQVLSMDTTIPDNNVAEVTDTFVYTKVDTDAPKTKSKKK